MSVQLIQNVLSLQDFSEDEIQQFIACFTSLKLKKNDNFISQGEICNKVGFVTSGILRNYYLSSKSEEVTYCLTFPNNFVNAFSSFVTSEPTKETIHAITDVEMLVMKKDTFLALQKSNIKWLETSKKIAEGAYIKLEKYIFMLQMESAESRYEELMNSYPEYLQQIPLKYLASYLGITQRHLSRIRKKVF